MSAKHRRLRHLDYLEHMLEAVRLVHSHTEGMSKTVFLDDKKTQQAVILNILIIGEAAMQIATEYPDLVGRYPGLPWKQMRGMRNRMTHGYFETNLDIVWDTAQQSLPTLGHQVLDILQQLKVRQDD